QNAGASKAASRRHGENERMAERGADDGQTRTHVSARHFDDCHSRRQSMIGDRLEQYGLGGAVLDASARLHELGFGKDPSPPTICSVELEEGRIADQVER